MATREQQRARTRQAIVDAAASLVADGASDISIEDIAEAAGVSRATMYRYFDSVPDVLWQVVADRDLARSDVEMDGVDDVVERVLIAERLVNDYLFGDPRGTRTFEHAMLERTLTGASLDDDRPARRLIYIDDALRPIAEQLGDRYGEIRHALALAMGSHSVIAMLDSCRLSVDDGRAATKTACRAIAESAVRLVESSTGATSERVTARASS